jgi:drug/metabolite transporter (DMT)-like permease
MCLPLLVVPGLLVLQQEPALWWSMALCAVLAVAGNVLLVAALQTADLSILGPVNAYKSVIGLVLGVIVIGERPTAMGMAGILLILLGSAMVAERGAGEPRRNAFVAFFRERGIQLRFAALALAAAEAVLLKKAILLSSPLMTFVLWSTFGLPIAALAILVLLKGRTRREIHLVRENFSTYVWLGTTTLIMELSTIYTLGRLQVGYSLALFQMSTLISVFLGYTYFNEKDIRKRLLGSVVMTAGAVMIVVFGTART